MTLTLGLLGFHYSCPYGSPTCTCERDVCRLLVVPELTSDDVDGSFAPLVRALRSGVSPRAKEVPK